MKTRLNSNVFDLPVQEMRRGYLSDIYFWREKIVLEEHGLHPEAVTQIFQKKEAVLCGIDEAIGILKLGSGRYKDYSKAYKLFDRLMELKKEGRNWYLTNKERYLNVIRQKLEINSQLDDLWESGFDALEIEALFDGDKISPREPVMHIKGDPSLYAHLESMYLGVLARRTKVATNVHNVVQAANGTTVLFFPARFDHWATQGGDGYAAHIGGVGGVATPTQGEWWGASASGTVPHALIAACGGDTVQATRFFNESYPDTGLVALVDFDNDCIGTALKCAREFGERLWGIRMDTSENMVDKAVLQHMGDFSPTGVIPELVFAMREALDAGGFNHVKIVVSGGFNPEKIRRFESLNAPVDAYGVGSCLLQGENDFTADIVRVNGRHCAKAGRWFKKNDRLSAVAKS